jgi:hypothetical protein
MKLQYKKGALLVNRRGRTQRIATVLHDFHHLQAIRIDLNSVASDLLKDHLARQKPQLLWP